MENMILQEAVIGDKVTYTGAIKKLAASILEKKITLLGVTEVLGDCLTHTEAQKRAKGLEISADIIQLLPKDYLREDEISLFIAFFVGKLKDVHVSVISEAIRGLLTISQCTKLSFKHVDAISSGVFQEIFTQSLVQRDRNHVFKIFHIFLTCYLDDVKLLDEKFISGFIQAIEGEKDPHNLRLIFNVIPIVINNFNIDFLIDDIFEVIACYFPINYSPSPNDVKAVTKEELVLSLRKCLVSTPKFSESLIPLLLEKLDSDIASAKLDALETLIECCKTYNWNHLIPFYSDIWKTVRREVFTTIDQDEKLVALRALTAVFKLTSLRMTEIDIDFSFDNLITDILNECSGYVKQTDFNFANSTYALLNALCLSSPEIATKIFEDIIPTIINLYSENMETNKKKVLLEAYGSFLKSHGEIFQSENYQPISRHKGILLKIFNDAVDGVDSLSIKYAAVSGLIAIATTKGLLNESELQQLVDKLARLAVHINQTVFNVSLISALGVLSQAESIVPVIKSHLLPKIMQTVKDCNEESNSNNLKLHLKLLTAVLTNFSVVEIYLPELISCLYETIGWKSTCILQSINEVAKKFSFETTHVESWQSHVLLPILKFLNPHSTSSTQSESFYFDVGLILQSVMPLLDDRSSENVLDELLGKHYQENSDLTVILLDAFLKCTKQDVLHRNVKISSESFVKDLTKVVFRIVKNTDSLEKHSVSACRCLASLFNKLASGDSLDEVILHILTDVKEILNHQNLELQTKSRIIHLLTWITKALVMKNHKHYLQYVQMLLDSLEKEHVSGLIAKDFSLVLEDFNDCFNVSYHYNVRLLYKQRFFVLTFQKLMDGFNLSASEVRCNYLTALVSQLSLIPKEILLTEAKNLMVTLMKGLLMSDAQMLLSILSLLSILIQSDSKVVEPYCDTLIDNLLKLTIFKGNMKVRIESLRCLSLCTLFSTDLIQKCKYTVTQHLVSALDDHKRLVRKEAAITRSCWYLVGC